MKYYVTLTGLNYHFGVTPFRVGQKVTLIKEPENEFDHEAIHAELPGLGKVGYVANSARTVLGDCFSAGRMYDKIGDIVPAKVIYVLDRAVICSIKQKHTLMSELPTVPESVLPTMTELDPESANENEDIPF